MKKVVMPLTEYNQDIQDNFTKGYNRAINDISDRIVEAIALRDKGDHRQAMRALDEVFDDNYTQQNKVADALKINRENEPSFTE
jgi:replication-associated recombination protein RarA